MHIPKWKESIWKGYLLENSNYDIQAIVKTIETVKNESGCQASEEARELAENKGVQGGRSKTGVRLLTATSSCLCQNSQSDTNNEF